jgi:hypothetical protein
MSEDKASERENIFEVQAPEALAKTSDAASKSVLSFSDREFGSALEPTTTSVSLEPTTTSVPTIPDRFEHNTVFIIMSFLGEGMREVYSVIKDECSRLGLRAIRVDELFGSGFIIKDILQGIERAEFIICDLTHERPNVYYELGYAHGVGNHGLNILLIAKDSTQLHFDIAPLRVQKYQSPRHLQSILASNLQIMISSRQKTR